MADEKGTRAVILDPRSNKRKKSWNNHNASSLMWSGPLSQELGVMTYFHRTRQGD